MSRVFVVQRPATFDRAARRFVDKFDISPAAKYGELVYMLQPGNIFRDRMELAVSEIRSKLSTFSDADHLLAVGDPVAIAMSVLIASQSNPSGRVSLLKYDRVPNGYVPYMIDPNCDK